MYHIFTAITMAMTQDIGSEAVKRSIAQVQKHELEKKNAQVATNTGVVQGELVQAQQVEEVKVLQVAQVEKKTIPKVVVVNKDIPAGTQLNNSKNLKPKSTEDILKNLRQEETKRKRELTKLEKENLESSGLEVDGDFARGTSPSKDTLSAGDDFLSAKNKVKTEVKKTEEKTPTKTETKIEEKTEVKTEEKIPATDAKTLVKTETKVEEKSVAKTETPTQIKTETKSQVTTETKSELKDQKAAAIPIPPLSPAERRAAEAKIAKEKKEAEAQEKYYRENTRIINGSEQNSLPKENITQPPVETSIQPSTPTSIKASNSPDPVPVPATPTRAEIEKMEKVKAREAASKLKEERRQAKLAELRKKYLEDFSRSLDVQVNSAGEYGENPGANSNNFTIPKKKVLPKFIVYTIPEPLLERPKSDQNRHNPDIVTPEEYVNFMFSAIAQNRLDDFRSLYDIVRDPNIVNSRGDTVLIFAILMQRYEAVSTLLANGANPNLKNQLGFTPLNVSIEMSDYIATELLVMGGANLRYVDNYGVNYLMQAIKVGYFPIVDFLIDTGIDINAADNDGFTALDYAIKSEDKILIKYLQKLGARTGIDKKKQMRKDRTLIEELQNRWR